MATTEDKVGDSLVNEELAGGASQKPVKKERIRRPERPSRDALTKEIADVNAQIADCNKRIQEIKEAFESQKQGRQSVEQEVQAAKLQLAGTAAEFAATVEQKRALRSELAAADEARKRMRDELKSLRDRLPFVKVEQIDEEIKKLEYRLSHTTVSLSEEKKMVQQIRDLGKAREYVKDYNERVERIEADEGSRAELTVKIREKDEALNALRAKEAQQKSEVEALRGRARSAALDVPALLEERDRKHAEIRVLRDKIRSLNSEFREKEDEYWVKERQWQAQQAEERKKLYEEREQRRREAEARRKAREAENYVEPYTDEIIICDQLVAYVEKLKVPAGAEVGEQQQDGEEVEQRDLSAASGFGRMVLSKKSRGEEELDSWFGGMGKKGKKKASGRARDRGERFVSHSLDALNSFGKIEVVPPKSAGDFEDTIEVIKAKKVEFEKLQLEEREKRAALLAGEVEGGKEKTGEDKAAGEDRVAAKAEEEPDSGKEEGDEKQGNGVAEDNQGGDGVVEDKVEEGKVKGEEQLIEGSIADEGNGGDEAEVAGQEAARVEHSAEGTEAQAPEGEP